MLTTTLPSSKPFELRRVAHNPNGRNSHEYAPQPNKSLLPDCRLWRRLIHALFKVCPSVPRPCPGPKPTLSYDHHNEYGLSNASPVSAYCHKKNRPTNKITTRPKANNRMHVAPSLRSSKY